MENNIQKIDINDLNNTFDLEDTLIQLNRLSHFLDHERFSRQEVFRKCIILNFHSYFIDNNFYVDGLVKRLQKKICLLNENEYKIDDPSIQSYIHKIWEDIFTILDLFEEHIGKVIKRFENGINTDFKIDITDIEKTGILREIQKLEKPAETGVRKGQSWFNDSNFSHDK